MHARIPTFRTTDAPAATLRRRMALAVARRFGSRHVVHPQAVPPSADRFERMELDQRVREIGEW